MHERLAADDAEEDVAHLLSFADQAVHGIGLDRFLLGGHVDPATLAAQVAAVDDRDVEEGRKHLALFQPAFVLLNGEHPLPAHVPDQLPEEALVGLEQDALSHLQCTCFTSVRICSIRATCRH